MITIKFKGEALDILLKYVCSGNINFIIGSGASYPAIQTLGNLENEITDLVRQNGEQLVEELEEKVVEKINGFINDSVIPNNILLKRIKPKKKKKAKYKLGRDMQLKKIKATGIMVINYEKNIKYVLKKYRDFIQVVHELLLMRANDKYPKKINIFTTNYDLFFECACETLDVPYNDGGNGFIRRTFSTKNFQKKIIRLSDYYAYAYEEPILNILKLHGSVNWSVGKSDIDIKNSVVLREIGIENVNERGHIKDNIDMPIILPTKQKFVRTLLEHIYYDMSRYYANELEREQSVLFCFGFSFADEHIRSITKRALGNPSLTLIIFPYNDVSEAVLIKYFKNYNNVKVVRLVKNDSEIHVEFIDVAASVSDRVNIDFSLFINLFECLRVEAKNQQVSSK